MKTVSGILSNSNSICDRRRALGIGAGAFSLPQLLCSESLAAAQEANLPSFGRAKNILLLYLQGAASQLETWDPKPDAPEGIRGKWGAISTAIPGVAICEKLPRLSRLTDRMAIIRSMTHDNSNHSNLYTLSGAPAIDFTSETNPADTRHRPFFGSVLDYLAERSGTSAPSDVPRNIGLPWRFSSFTPFVRRAGPYASFLGQGYDPVWTEFAGKATQKVSRVSFFDPGREIYVADPYLGITPESRLRASKDLQLRDGLTLDRIDRRRELLRELNEKQRQQNDHAPGRSFDRFAGMAYSMINSPKVRTALDVGLEPISVREQYGMTLFGQAALTGRRLLEAGCPLVSVFWDEYEVINTAWDTHFDHFTRLENELLPGFDAAVSSLLIDLEQRGLLQETLVMCLTEHGRTPKVSTKDKGGGRDHWSKAYSVMLAGAGIKPGVVVGASDAIAAFVKDRPVSPEDILATMYHLKGIPEETTIPDRRKRPMKLVDNGSIIEEILVT